MLEHGESKFSGTFQKDYFEEIYYNSEILLYLTGREATTNIVR